MGTPNYLKDYEELYQSNPREAALEWFRKARYGLFMHYGLYSLLGRHEWVQLKEKISVADMEKYAEQFTAEKFDAEFLADFAVDCGMKYINITTRHHESFCLFESKETDFTTVNAAAKRDLVAELAKACDSRGLGLCLYYSHGRDWKHPHAPNNDKWGGSARPKYETPDPAYAYGEENDLQKYLDFMTAQITELLTNYGPIAAIWLDGIAVPYSGDRAEFKCQELYDLIHSLQPQVLISYKQGLTGTEDFFAPERKLPSADDGKSKSGLIAENRETPVEICTTMTPGSWGWKKDASGTHKSEENVWEELKTACSMNYNLLLNTGPLPDGSLEQEDEQTLRAVGARIRKEGFPS